MKHHTTHQTSVRRVTATLLAVGALTALTACGDDEKATATTAAPTTAAPTTVASAEITFVGQWARNSPAMASRGAAYVTITSPIDDKLLGASAGPGIAAAVEIHEMVMVEATDTTMDMGSDTTMDMGSDTTMDMGSDTTMSTTGEMVMRPVEFIELPAGTPVELKPGGYHIMFIDLVAPLEIGTILQLTLTFENAGEVTIDVPVLEEAPTT